MHAAVRQRISTERKVSIMTATKVRQPELVAAQEIIACVGTKDFRGALARAERAARKFPEFRIPTPEGQPSPTFAETATWLRSQIKPAEQAAPVAQPEPVKVPEPVKPAARKAPAARKPATARKPEPVKAPEPVKVEVQAIRLVHDGKNHTSIYDMVKGSPAQLAIGSAKRGGLGWAFWSGGPCFYLPRTAGYAPDYVAINRAISAIESIEQDGQKLYRVESEITTVGPDGKPLPTKMSAEERARWQREYTAGMNAHGFSLRMEQGQCGTCGVAGLSETTGRIGKDGEGLPVIECWTCGGFAAPVVEAKPEPVRESAPDLSGLMLAIAATAAPTSVCPMCSESVPLVDGKLGLHSYRGAACRGRLGMVRDDVEPEPVQQPAKARKAAPVKAESAVVETPEVDDEPADASELVVRFALQNGLSGKARNDTASEVRSVLSRKITWGRAFRGVKVETRRDKVNHRLVLHVVEGGEGFDAAELADAISAAVRTVRGVANRVRKG